MAARPYTRHGFRLRPLAEVIEALRRAGLPLIDHRRSGRGEGAPHVLVVQSSQRQRGV